MRVCACVCTYMMNQYIIGLIIVAIIVFGYVQISGSEKMLNNTRRIYLHSVEWCPHCKTMKPVWDSVIAATAGSGIIFTDVDEDKAKTPGINGYPTIIMLDENGYRHKYTGGPDFNKLRNWVVAPAPITTSG